MFRYRSMKEIKKKLKRKRGPILALGLFAGMLLAWATCAPGEEGLVKTAWSVWPAVIDNAASLTDQAQEHGTAAALKATLHSRNAIGANANVGLEPGGRISLFDGMPFIDTVVRTFFQLDILSLETRMSPEMLFGLTAGIRVTDDKLPGAVASAEQVNPRYA